MRMLHLILPRRIPSRRCLVNTTARAYPRIARAGASGGELDPIRFMPGHVSIQTTDLGRKQRLRLAVNDRLGIEPDAASRPIVPGQI
jgi:hypothetical protein